MGTKTTGMIYTTDFRLSSVRISKVKLTGNWQRNFFVGNLIVAPECREYGWSTDVDKLEHTKNINTINVFDGGVWVRDPFETIVGDSR